MKTLLRNYWHNKVFTLGRFVVAFVFFMAAMRLVEWGVEAYSKTGRFAFLFVFMAGSAVIAMMIILILTAKVGRE